MTYNSQYVTDMTSGLNNVTQSLDNVIFSNNVSNTNNAGISLSKPRQGSSLEIRGGLFYANTLTAQSIGIIDLFNYDLTIKDSAFIANQVGGNAVISAGYSKISVEAQNSDVVFAENTKTNSTTDASAIYLENGSSLDLKAAAGKTIYFDDPIAGKSPAVTINPTNAGSNLTGRIVFSTNMTLNSITHPQGTLSIEKDGTQITTHIYTQQGILELAKGTTFSANTWNMQSGAQFRITGNATISAPTFAFADNSQLNFYISNAIDRDSPLLEINQTSNTGSVINLNPVNINVTVDAATAAAPSFSELTLLHSTSGLENDPKSFTSSPNNFFTYELSEKADSFIVTMKKDEPEVPIDPEKPEPEPTPEPEPGDPLDDYLATLEDMGASANQNNAFGSLFDSYSDKNSPWYDDFNSLWQYLQHAPQNEVLSAISAVMPDISPLVIENERGIVNDIKDSAFAAPKNKTPLSRNVRMWLKVSDASIDGDPHRDADSFDLDRTGAVLGFEKDISPAFTLGGGYAYSDSDGSTGKRDIEASTHSVFLSAAFNYENFTTQALLTGGFSDYDEKVNVPTLAQFKDSFDVRTLGATVQSGYAFTTAFGTFTPELGLSYLNLHADSHNGPLGQSFSSADADFLTAYTGLNYAAELLRSGTGSLSVEGSLHVAYDLVSDGLDRKATLADGSYYYVDGVKPSATRVIPALDLKYNLSDNFSIAAGFKYAAGEDYEDKSWHLSFDLKI